MLLSILLIYSLQGAVANATSPTRRQLLGTALSAAVVRSVPGGARMLELTGPGSDVTFQILERRERLMRHPLLGHIVSERFCGPHGWPWNNSLQPNMSFQDRTCIRDEARLTVVNEMIASELDLAIRFGKTWAEVVDCLDPIFFFDREKMALVAANKDLVLSFVRRISIGSPISGDMFRSQFVTLAEPLLNLAIEVKAGEEIEALESTEATSLPTVVGSWPRLPLPVTSAASPTPQQVCLDLLAPTDHDHDDPDGEELELSGS